MQMQVTAARQLDPQAAAAIDAMQRTELCAALEWGGYATWDHEPISELRECLRGAVADGEIDLQTVVL